MEIVSFKFLHDLVTGLSTVIVLRTLSAVLTTIFFVTLVVQLITRRKIQISILLMLSVNFLTFVLLTVGKLTLDIHALESRPINNESIFFSTYIILHLVYIGFLNHKLSRFFVNLFNKTSHVPKILKCMILGLAAIFLGTFLMSALWLCVVSNLFCIPISYYTLTYLSTIVSICNTLVGLFISLFLSKGHGSAYSVYSPFSGDDQDTQPIRLCGDQALHENDVNKKTKVTKPQPDSMYPYFEKNNTIKKGYFNLDVKELTVAGLQLWELSNGSDQLKLSRGVAFLEYFHRIHINLECIDAAMSVDGFSFPVNNILIALSILHEACKQFASTSETLREIIKYEEELPKIKEEIEHLAEVRLDNYVAFQRQEELFAMERGIIKKLDILAAMEPLSLPVEVVKEVLAKYQNQINGEQ